MDAVDFIKGVVSDSLTSLIFCDKRETNGLQKSQGSEIADPLHLPGYGDYYLGINFVL